MTLGYDTIYGYQDIKDDEIIGLKSTSIKFKGREKKFIFLCYSIFITLFLIGGYSMQFNYLYFLLFLITIFHLIYYQIKTFNPKIPIKCLEAFKSNNVLGMIIFLNILVIKNI